MFLAVSISDPCPPFHQPLWKSATASRGTRVMLLALGFDSLASGTIDQTWPSPYLGFTGYALYSSTLNIGRVEALMGHNFIECEMLGKGYLSPWVSSSLLGSLLPFLSYELLRPRNIWAASPHNIFSLWECGKCEFSSVLMSRWSPLFSFQGLPIVWEPLVWYLRP